MKLITLFMSTLFLFNSITPGLSQDNFCFYHNSENGYFCELLNGIYQNLGDEFIITGTHTPGFFDQDVVRIITSTTIPSILKYIPAAIFQKFTNLQSVDLHNSGVESLDGLQSCAQLERIYLNDNAIKKISSGTFANCPNLKSISIEGNELSEIDVDAFKSLQKLQTLALKNNSIVKLIPKTFDLLPELQSVDLQANYVDEILSNLFYSLPKLENIHLEYNKVEKIHDNAFRNLTALAHLSINDNAVSEMGLNAFYALDNLESLYLYNNSINKLKSNSFSKMPKLITLRIDNNNVTAIQGDFFDNFPNLKELKAQGNLCINRDLQVDENFLSFFQECFTNWRESNPTTTTPGGAAMVHITFSLLFLTFLLSKLA